MSTPVAFASLPTARTGVHADQSVANVQAKHGFGIGKSTGVPVPCQDFWFNSWFCELLQTSEHPHVNSLVGGTATGSQELFQRAGPLPRFSLNQAATQVTVTSMMAVLVAARGRARRSRIPRFESQPSAVLTRFESRPSAVLTHSPPETYQELVQVRYWKMFGCCRQG